ncbi:MAG: LLM class flavin-dependent oxidoreductase, partial [Chloroflexota bacterium]|nr:LLM class flavin-dependent oxidoreductase [Chloroflexota bacterium]
QLPPIYVAASGPSAARTAGQIGDGLITTSPNTEVVNTFNEAGGNGKPRYAEFTVCWAESEEEARRTAYEWWPNSALKGELSQELPTPTHFEQAAKMVTEKDVAEEIVCGPDVQKHIQGIQKYLDAGINHVFIHQVGPDQDGFFRFYEQEVLPALATQPA